MSPIPEKQDRKETPESIVSSLKKTRFPQTFNPYMDTCAICDRDKAPNIRSQALVDTLAKARNIPVEALWIARDPGYRGARRTGLAMTDDFQLQNHARRWGIKAGRATRGTMVREKTASVVWEMLDNIDQNIFLWNLFPLHPFPKENEFANRSHTASEKEAGLKIVRKLVALTRPERIIAIGRDAEKALLNETFGFRVFEVRHPSYGGENLFRERIRNLYPSGFPGKPTPPGHQKNLL